MTDPQVLHAMAAFTSCKANAQRYAPIWMAVIAVGIVVFLIGLVWILVASISGRAAWSRPVMERASDHGTRSPFWPLLLGLAVVAAGIFLGYAVDVGPYCDGAFAVQNSASGADIANAMSGRRSDYSSECLAAASQQSVIYWGIIGFGAAVFILGLLLRTVLGSRAAVHPVATVSSELEQLAALRDRGVLTDDEFDQQKRRLLAPE
ncbi:SHOCT domain-containing protein [Pseudarthrobacter scleromae]|uniref:SHOCT domain-containing protein n=1 Tax=Pseudarthrobacter scleromae TaxID=158897 RepID=UPI003645D4A0